MGQENLENWWELEGRAQFLKYNIKEGMYKDAMNYMFVSPPNPSVEILTALIVLVFGGEAFGR